MNLGIDIRVLTRGTRTGVEEYTINLLKHLLPLEPSLNVRLFYNGFLKRKPHYRWMDLPNVRIMDFRIPNRFFFVSARCLSYPKIDKLIGGTEVYFNPHFFLAPVSGSCRKINTFHDLSFERYPEFFSWRKRLWQSFLMNARREALRADKIIAVSHSTKEDLVNLYGIDEKKIEVIYLGVAESFLKQDRTDLSYLKKVKEKYRLPKNFILYFGTIEPRKNLLGLIKSFELAKEKNPSSFCDLKLVMAGARGWLCQDIFKAVSRSKYSPDIFLPGFIEEEDKPALYSLAKLFVYPSFFEGFGFPPLEAMACGVPVITSSSASLPEVAGKAGLMVDVSFIDEMAWAIEEVLTNRQLEEKLVKEGRNQAKKFSWQECARKTAKAIAS